MPFKSTAQRAFLAIHEPGVAHEFAKKTPEHAKLPEHVKKLASGGLACHSCGGVVETDGASRDLADDGESEWESEHESEEEEMREPPGAEYGESEQHEAQENQRQRAFANAISRRRGR
jgi:hypothetical protein